MMLLCSLSFSLYVLSFSWPLGFAFTNNKSPPLAENLTDQTSLFHLTLASGILFVTVCKLQSQLNNHSKVTSNRCGASIPSTGKEKLHGDFSLIGHEIT